MKDSADYAGRSDRRPVISGRIVGAENAIDHGADARESERLAL
jgi:hypothetical protein